MKREDSFFYIVLAKGNLEEINNHENIIIIESDDNKIEAELRISSDESISFILRKKSGLLMIKTNYSRKKNRFFYYFNKVFEKVHLENFVPILKNEIKFICEDFNYESFKVFVDDEIISSENTGDIDICKGLKNNMELIQVSLYRDLNNNDDIYFDYYGNALQFYNSKQESIEEVLNIFEKTMIINAR